ncbi:sensor domain-containing diguanylate cyclase [Spirochaeta isovalerica]|uniref:diguanylate cyclase n=1 Tax=Spirochaeta isovalerica TaxID=150 RepID=A0A841RDB2_9SPIO|nr:sensor domain-containing diguanylate cyclase [Spirochaeta isovalerica]MBB6480980.1 diguanylate cyclase (GGDEF)-like protein/PAS domain S-box-containing protein [Spirochaeta isovalerica]
MERKVDPDQYGMAYALLRCDNTSLYLLDCNAIFRELSGLECHKKKNAAQIAFGDRTELSLEKILTRDTMILTFARTGKSLKAGRRKVEEGLFELIGIDFTEYQRKEEYMQFRTAGYRQFIENLQGIAFQRMLKPERLAMFTSGALEKLSGYPEDQARDLASWLEIIHPDDRDRMAEEGLKIYEKPGYENESEYRIIRKDGEIRWVRSYDNHFRSEDGDFEMVQGLIVDVTVQKKQEEKIREQNILLEELSITDHMTGLSNRRFMSSILEHFISDYRRSGETFSLLMLDLDHFKLVNDRFGHDGGDAVIKKMAEILRHNLRETDLKARWGGEEFLVLLPRTDRREAVFIGEKLLDIVRSVTVTHNKIDIKFTFSCGVAVNDRRLSEEILLKHADKALYLAKEEGRNRVVLWSDK